MRRVIPLLLLAACSGDPDPNPGFTVVSTATANPPIVMNAQYCIQHPDPDGACCFNSPKPGRYDACRGTCCAAYRTCQADAGCALALQGCTTAQTCGEPSDPLALVNAALAGCFQRSSEAMRMHGNGCMSDMPIEPGL